VYCIFQVLLIILTEGGNNKLFWQHMSPVYYFHCIFQQHIFESTYQQHIFESICHEHINLTVSEKTNICLTEQYKLTKFNF
jgi:hypothetical protein